MHIGLVGLASCSERGLKQVNGKVNFVGSVCFAEGGE